MTNPKPKYSVLIIGCGAIAGGYDAQDIGGDNILTHAKAFNIHAGFELAGCVDLDREIAQNFADTWDVDRAYDDLEAAMNDREFDIISICTSTASHENYLRQLQKYDVKLIFCEKPITNSLDTAREMAEIYSDKMAVNYLRRFDPDIRQLTTDITSGIYGDFKSARAVYNKGLYNNGSHMTDLLHMLIGPVFVRSAENVIYDFWPDDPTISARLVTAADDPIDMVGSDMRDGMTFDLELEFDNAQIILNDFSHTLIIIPKGGIEKKITTDLDRGMLNAVSNIYDHLTEGAKLFSQGDNAVLALETCDGIRKAAGS